MLEEKLSSAITEFATHATVADGSYQKHELLVGKWQQLKETIQEILQQATQDADKKPLLKILRKKLPELIFSTKKIKPGTKTNNGPNLSRQIEMARDNNAASYLFLLTIVQDIFTILFVEQRIHNFTTSQDTVLQQRNHKQTVRDMKSSQKIKHKKTNLIHTAQIKLFPLKNTRSLFNQANRYMHKLLTRELTDLQHIQQNHAQYRDVMLEIIKGTHQTAKNLIACRLEQLEALLTAHSRDKTLVLEHMELIYLHCKRLSLNFDCAEAATNLPYDCIGDYFKQILDHYTDTINMINELMPKIIVDELFFLCSSSRVQRKQFSKNTLTYLIIAYLNETLSTEDVNTIQTAFFTKFKDKKILKATSSTTESIPSLDTIRSSFIQPLFSERNRQLGQLFEEKIEDYFFLKLQQSLQQRYENLSQFMQKPSLIQQLTSPEYIPQDSYYFTHFWQTLSQPVWQHFTQYISWIHMPAPQTMTPFIPSLVPQFITKPLAPYLSTLPSTPPPPTHHSADGSDDLLQAPSISSPLEILTTQFKIKNQFIEESKESEALETTQQLSEHIAQLKNIIPDTITQQKDNLYTQLSDIMSLDYLTELTALEQQAQQISEIHDKISTLQNHMTDFSRQLSAEEPEKQYTNWLSGELLWASDRVSTLKETIVSSKARLTLMSEIESEEKEVAKRKVKKHQPTQIPPIPESTDSEIGDEKTNNTDDTTDTRQGLELNSRLHKALEKWRDNHDTTQQTLNRFLGAARRNNEPLVVFKCLFFYARSALYNKIRLSIEQKNNKIAFIEQKKIAFIDAKKFFELVSSLLDSFQKKCSRSEQALMQWVSLARNLPTAYHPEQLELTINMLCKIDNGIVSNSDLKQLKCLYDHVFFYFGLEIKKFHGQAKARVEKHKQHMLYLTRTKKHHSKSHHSQPSERTRIARAYKYAIEHEDFTKGLEYFTGENISPPAKLHSAKSRQPKARKKR